MTTSGPTGVVEPGGPEDRLLTWDRVRSIAGISRTTAWRMQKAGDFPRPVAISPKRVGWWESELTAWKASRRDSGLKPLAPARAPKLIETARSPRQRAERTGVGAPASAPTGARSGTASSGPPVQPSLFNEKPPATVSGTQPAVKRRPRSSPDQIDFGF